jgi:hypothetical protein
MASEIMKAPGPTAQKSVGGEVVLPVRRRRSVLGSHLFSWLPPFRLGIASRPFASNATPDPDNQSVFGSAPMNKKRC